MMEMILNDPTMLAVTTFFIFWLGCCIGSFLNVCIWRIPRGESIVHPPSHCPVCNDAIPFYLNVPILSWCMLRGKCRSCKTPISPRYVIVELMVGLLYLLLWGYVLHQKLPLAVLPGWLTLAPILVTCSFTDVETRLIPNKLTFFGVVTGFVLSGFFPVMQGVDAPGVLFSLQNEFFLPLIKNALGVTTVLGGQAWIESIALSAFGIAFGYIFLALFIEIGKILFGKERVSRKESVDFKMKENSLVFGDQEYSLDSLLIRKSDKIVVELEDSNLVEISCDGSFLNGEKVDVLPDGMKSKRWILPREVMGYGDAKLLAACGAFLGAEGVILSLMIASVLATAMMTPVMILSKKKHRYLPFGCFIALGVLVLLIGFSVLVG